jgi:hypothetical protein
MPSVTPFRRAKGGLSPAAKARLEQSLTLRLRGRSERGHTRRSGSHRSLIASVVAVTLFGFWLVVDFGPPLVGCSIKANISFGTSERIYHVPGQEYYDATRIDLLKGERWFCSEDAARAAGWRKAGR